MRGEESASVVDPLLMFDGGDHQGWDRRAYALLNDWAQDDSNPYELVHTSLDAYLAEMLPQIDRIETRLEGELREPGWGKMDPEKDPLDMDQQWLIPGVLSSRVNLKQANAHCQTLLCHWAEPFSAFASLLLGVDHPDGLLNLSWRYLLQNHPHNSIDGCSIDQVHKDMEYRFDQSRQISRRLAIEATHYLAASVEGELGEDELRVGVFNPLPRLVERVVEIPLKIPPDWNHFNEFFGFEPKPAFRIFDAENNELPYQRLSQDKGRIEYRLRDTRFPEAVTYDEVRVAVKLAIPAMGYTTLTIREGQKGEFTRHADTPSLVTSERSMENEYLQVYIESNGTLTLTDKRNGQVYQRLMSFEDCADIGDGWYHGMAVNEQRFVSSASQAAVACLHDGPQMASFLVRLHFEIPGEFDFTGMRRSSTMQDLLLENRVTLCKGQDHVNIETCLINNVRDHRLRVLFPSGARTDTYLADSAFDVVERPIAIRPDNHLYRELEVETKPQQSWTAVHDEQRGLAIVADGLLETAVRDLPERPLALTLFRATRRTVGTTGEPGGQLLTELSFKYSIHPLQGVPHIADLCASGQDISAGLQIVHLDHPDIRQYRCETSLPRYGSFLELNNEVIVTSVRLVKGGLEVRMFNPFAQNIKSTLKVGWDFPGFTPEWIQQVDLESKPLGPEKPYSEVTEIEFMPKQIITVRLRI